MSVVLTTLLISVWFRVSFILWELAKHLTNSLVLYDGRAARYPLLPPKDILREQSRAGIWG